MRAAARTTTTDAALGPRALALDTGIFARGVEQVVQVDGATVLSTPGLPTVAHMNTIEVKAGLGADALERLAAEHHAGLPNHRLSIDDEAAAERVADELRRRGWTVERLLLLGRDGALVPPEARAPAEEVPYGHVRGLRDEWLRSAPWARSDELVAHAHEADRRLFVGTPTRAFATFYRGRPLAYALLIDGGRDGMLEDVYTTPEARGRGLASAVIAAVLHAARGARYEMVFVPTDADGKARALYERLGFAPLAIRHVFVKAVR